MSSPFSMAPASFRSIARRRTECPLTAGPWPIRTENGALEPDFPLTESARNTRPSFSAVIAIWLASDRVPGSRDRTVHATTMVVPAAVQVRPDLSLASSPLVSRRHPMPARKDPPRSGHPEAAGSCLGHRFGQGRRDPTSPCPACHQTPWRCREPGSPRHRSRAGRYPSACRSTGSAAPMPSPRSLPASASPMVKRSAPIGSGRRRRSHRHRRFGTR
jgi:hypothetical protein